MSEIEEPPLRLTIQGLRWLGEEFEPVGEAVPFDLFSTDAGDSATILRLLRQNALMRADMSLLGVSAKRESLDFNSPNHPTEEDLDEMLQHAERLLAALRVLRELSPEVVPDDEDLADDHGGPHA